MRAARLVTFAILLSALGGAVVASLQSPVTSRQSGHLASIDVIVSDARGLGVADLKATDFELREDGTAQTLEQVRFVRAAGAAGSADLAPRVFAIFLDEYHVTPGNAGRARAAMTQFIEREVGPGDLIVAMKPLDSLLTIKLTSDRDAARQSLES